MVGVHAYHRGVQRIIRLFCPCPRCLINTMIHKGMERKTFLRHHMFPKLFNGCPIFDVYVMWLHAFLYNIILSPFCRASLMYTYENAIKYVFEILNINLEIRSTSLSRIRWISIFFFELIPSRAPGFTPGFWWDPCCSSF